MMILTIKEAEKEIFVEGTQILVEEEDIVSKNSGWSGTNEFQSFRGSPRGGGRENKRGRGRGYFEFYNCHKPAHMASDYWYKEEGKDNANLVSEDKEPEEDTIHYC